MDYEKNILPDSKSEFMRDLDDSLKKSNSNYESKRYKDYLLLPPEHWYNVM